MSAAGRTTSHPFVDRLRRAGCWAVGVYLFVLFFGIGALVSLGNFDLLTTLQAVVIGGLLLGLGVWLARRNRGR